MTPSIDATDFFDVAPRLEQVQPGVEHMQACVLVACAAGPPAQGLIETSIRAGFVHPEQMMVLGCQCADAGCTAPQASCTATLMQRCLSGGAPTTHAMLQGWCWEDDDWHIDMTGLASHAVDEEGWSYAVDFGWLQLPPAPGSGRYRKARPAPGLVHRRAAACVQALDCSDVDKPGRARRGVRPGGVELCGRLSSCCHRCQACSLQPEALHGAERLWPEPQHAGVLGDLDQQGLHQPLLAQLLAAVCRLRWRLRRSQDHLRACAGRVCPFPHQALALAHPTPYHLRDRQGQF